MNRAEQALFITNLTQRAAYSIIDRVTNTPETAAWDGHELRVYIAETFANDASCSVIRKEPRTRRARDYKNTVLVAARL